MITNSFYFNYTYINVETGPDQYALRHEIAKSVKRIENNFEQSFTNDVEVTNLEHLA